MRQDVFYILFAAPIAIVTPIKSLPSAIHRILFCDASALIAVASASTEDKNVCLSYVVSYPCCMLFAVLQSAADPVIPRFMSDL